MILAALFGLITLIAGAVVPATPAWALEGEDLAGKAVVTFSPMKRVPKGGLYETIAIVRNDSDARIFGPMTLLVSGLDATGISLPSATGWTPSGEPYVLVPVPREGLAPGRSAKRVVLRFEGATSPDFAFGHTLFGLEARPETTLRTLPAVNVRLDPTVVVPRTRLRATWKVVGRRTARTKLEVRVRAPGGAANVPGKQWLHPGLGPATGPVSWLTQKGKWSEDRTLRRSAASGRAKLRLPTNAAGAWMLEVLLVDAKTGATIVSGSRTVLVSGEPGISLRISRPVANSLDLVRVTLTTTAGATPRPVRVLAWLVRPDGSQVGLPDLQPGRVDVFRGTSRNDEIRLLDTTFDAAEQGAYQVQVRLFDGATRGLLARASAGFEVSDAPASLTGVVRDAAGAPLDGTTATIATVQALDVDDLAVTASVGIDAAGAWTMTLEPGRYVVSATVIDAAGVHRAQAPALVEIDAAGTAVQLDLDAAPATPGPAKR